MASHRCVRAAVACNAPALGADEDGGEGKKASDPQDTRKHPEAPRISVGSNDSAFRSGGGVYATAALTKRLAMILLLSCLVAVQAVRAQGGWTPAVCGGARSSDYCSRDALQSWEKDVRALQALHRDCGNPWSWLYKGVWDKIPGFSGTQDDWKALCKGTGANEDPADELLCDDDGRITRIYVKQPSLYLACAVGLPSEFGDLSELFHIQMDRQFLYGGVIAVAQIFAPLRQLTKLKIISFDGNRLTGAIPALCDSSTLTSSMTKLETLRLSNNAISGPPTSFKLECMQNLQELDISRNGIAGQLPDTWRSLNSLKTLRLSWNTALGGTIPSAWFTGDDGMHNLVTLEAEECYLTGTIPTNFGAFTKLKTVNLNTNMLSGTVPASFTSLASLVSLDISSNQLSGSLPANLFTSMSVWLRDVYLNHNFLSGTIPQMASDSQMLVNLNLADNAFMGSIPSLASATNLETLVLNNNFLNGTIPVDLSSLYFLSTLKLQHNQLSGALPDLSRAPQLTTVDLSENRLSSGLGTWLGTNKNLLTSVNLAMNNLTGEFPSTFCFRKQTTLDLRDNNLWGTIPESIKTCTELQSLHLGKANNPRSSGGVVEVGAGRLPSSSTMASLTSLTEFSVAGLGLGGTVPTSLFSLSNLEHLDLSHNNFNGSVPNVTAGALQQLKTLKLEDNKLTGVVPESLLTLSRLLHLYLGDNLITGVQSPQTSSYTIRMNGLHLAGNMLTAFPPVLLNMTSLTTLDLSRNRLEGAPPAWLGELERLRDLRLSGNKLRGPLTAWLNENNRLTALTKLLLDGNEGITGPLTAAAIRPLAKLRTLNLDGIKDFGTFPEALGTPEASLVALTEFHASDAGLTGELPARFFEALKNLERLDLRRNKLTGTIPHDSGGGAAVSSGSRRMLLLNTTSSLTSPVLTHAKLNTLLLSDNLLGGLIPALPSRIITSGVSVTTQQVDFTNAAGTSGFECPLPSDHPAYSTAACTCSAGRAGPDSDGRGPGRYKCDACTPGAVAPTSGTTVCAPCSLGHFAANRGGTKCEPCSPGAMANVTGSATCTRCLPGTFADAAAASSCIPCAAGHHQPDSGGTGCTACAPGSAAAPGSATCTPCRVGTFTSTARAAACDVCLPGTYQNRTGQSGCVDCPPGTASPIAGASNASVCTPCAEGTSTRGDRAQGRCYPCEPGSFAGPGMGAARCQLAPLGHASSDVGAFEATKCPAGTHAPTRGLTRCLPCPPNEFQPYEGKSACMRCPENAIAEPETGGLRCKCRAGNVATAKSGGGITCTPCAPGYYLNYDNHNDGTLSSSSSSSSSSTALLSECIACSGDTYTATNGSATCTPLSPGHVGADFAEPGTMKGARRETACPAGTRVRSTLVGLAMVSVCESCPNGTISPRGSSNCTACPFGSLSNDAKTQCLDIANIAGGGAGGGPSGSNNDTSDDTSLVGRAVSAAADGKFGGQTAALAFFLLLGVCALFFGFAAGLYRRRQRRLHLLALEREYLLEAAEAELASGRPMRRETLYALAGVDAESAALGGGVGGGGLLSDAGGGAGLLSTRQSLAPGRRKSSSFMRRKSAPDQFTRRRGASSHARGGGGNNNNNNDNMTGRSSRWKKGGIMKGAGGGDDDDELYGYPEGFDYETRRGSAPVNETHGARARGGGGRLLHHHHDIYNGSKHHNYDYDEHHRSVVGGGGGGGGGGKRQHRSPSVRGFIDDDIDEGDDGLRDFRVDVDDDDDGDAYDDEEGGFTTNIAVAVENNGNKKSPIKKKNPTTTAHYENSDISSNISSNGGLGGVALTPSHGELAARAAAAAAAAAANSYYPRNSTGYTMGKQSEDVDYPRKKSPPARVTLPPPPTAASTEDIFMTETQAASAPPAPRRTHHRHHHHPQHSSTPSTATFRQDPHHHSHHHHEAGQNVSTPAAAPSAANRAMRFSHHHTTPSRQQQSPALDDRFVWSQ